MSFRLEMIEPKGRFVRVGGRSVAMELGDTTRLRRPEFGGDNPRSKRTGDLAPIEVLPRSAPFDRIITRPPDAL